MQPKIIVKEVPIEEVVEVNKTIVEFREPYTREQFEERYGDKEKLIIVAHINKQPAGYIVSYDRFDDGSLYCWRAGVDPQFRRKGVLKALMDYQEQWARKHGYKKIKIKTRNKRREMLAYLVKYGFYFTEVIQHSAIEENRILLEKRI
ncbi:GNAT family N-acetyltransferase [Candidatus Woesearchaeota archaeon]|nr:GNAT family N-acetyltransferase [Candidatus Woesearchaeota archaeon]